MVVATRPSLSQSTEDYLKAIFMLEENGGSVSTNSLAEKLKVSAAAVTKAVQQLAKKKLVKYEPYRGVLLTQTGREVAVEMVRHHRLLETFLHEVLGYRWDQVDAEAERLEHHISEEFEARIDRLLNYPSFDPHGEPIPSPDGVMPPRQGKFLADCEPGETVVIQWVHDISPEVLQFLDRLGMRPGSLVAVRDRQPLQGPLTLQIDKAKHVVGREIAGCVFVRSLKQNELSKQED